MKAFLRYLGVVVLFTTYVLFSGCTVSEEKQKQSENRKKEEKKKEQPSVLPSLIITSVSALIDLYDAPSPDKE